MGNVVIGIMVGIVGIITTPLGAYTLFTSKPSNFQWRFGKSPEEQALRSGLLSAGIMVMGLGMLIYLGNELVKTGALNWLF